MSAHTPRPWSILDATPDGAYWIEGRAADGATVTLCGRPEWPSRAAMSLANARLISAAPDLLDALNTLRPYVECLVIDDHCATQDLATIDAAIAKAEGR